MVINGLEDVRFISPVRSGKRVRNHIKLSRVEHQVRNRYQVVTENTMEIEGENRPALTAGALAIFMA